MMLNWLKRTRLGGVLLALAIIAPMFMAATSSLADTLKFKDGRVWEGKILQEQEGLIKFRLIIGSISREQWVSVDDLAEVIRDADKVDTGAEDGSETEKKTVRPGDEGFDPDVPTLVFIPMEEMVGTYMNRIPLEEALKETEKYGKNAVAVLVFNSGGGMLLEIQPMSDLIERYKKKVRVVSWIKSAISAAAMTSLAIEEIYFMPEGNFGACTGFFGGGTAIKGKELDDVLLMMERISARGGYNPLIMRKMQVNWFDLSADIDANGVVTWHGDDSGEYMVSENGEILTFNSETAAKFGFAKGIAETEEELADLLQYDEWQRSDVGEKIMKRWHTTIREAERRVPETRVKLATVMGVMNAGNDSTRKRAIGEARRYLNALKSWHKRAEIVCLMNGIDDGWLREMDRQIREAARRD